MPSNQKTFHDVPPNEYATFLGNLRSKGWSPPTSDSGHLRGHGLFADLSYSPKESTLHILVRNLEKGDSYPSFFGTIETMLRKVDR